MMNYFFCFFTIRSIKFGTYMYLLTHFFACLWFMVGCPKNIVVDTSSGVVVNGSSISGNNSSFKPVLFSEQCRLDSWAMHDGRDLGIDFFFPFYFIFSLKTD